MFAGEAWARLIEAIHRSERDANAWASRIVRAWSALLPDADCVGFHFADVTATDQAVVVNERGFHVIARPLAGVVAALYASKAGGTHLTAHERRLLSCLALHLENAHRARLCGDAIRGVLTADGVVVARRPGPSIDLWSALIEGRVSFIAHIADGVKRHIIMDNPLFLRAARAFTDVETEVVRLAARALSKEASAYELGLLPSEVSEHLVIAAAKAGVLSEADLVHVATLTTNVESASSAGPTPPKEQRAPADESAGSLHRDHLH
jgi:DNA-binding CsgD family transcriptional regulator